MARKESVEIGELIDTALYILSSVIEEKHGYLIWLSANYGSKKRKV